MPNRVHLIIAGGGHAAVALFKKAAKWIQNGVRITLVNDHTTLYYSGMVPEYLGGVYAPNEVQVNLKDWCERTGMEWQQGKITAIDLENKSIMTDARTTLRCDLVVFDIGAQNLALSRSDGAIYSKPLHHIERLNLFLRNLNQKNSGLVIVGGGAAGVEVALNVSARILKQGPPNMLNIRLVESADRLLQEFPEEIGEYAQDLLRQRGVEIILSTPVVQVTQRDVVLTTGLAIRQDAVFWATGSTGQLLFREAGLACDNKHFLKVNRGLQCPDQPWIFAAGDCVSVAGYEDLAKIGVHAVKQGPVLAQNVGRTLRNLSAGKPIEETKLTVFRPYPVAPLILSTGAPEGIMVAGSKWFHNSAALRLKHFVDLRWVKKYQALGRFQNVWQMLHNTSASTSTLN